MPLHHHYSIQLRRYYSGSPVCSPTRGTVLTGRNHNRYCMWTANIGTNTADFTKPQGMSLPTSEVTVAEILKKQGYRTAIYGKWHLGNLKNIKGRHNSKWSASHPGMHGFDSWWVTERSAPTLNPNCGCFDPSLCVVGHYNNPGKCSNYHTMSPATSSKKEQLTAFDEAIEGDDSHFIVQLFAHFLKETISSGNPFFVSLFFHTVHRKFIATEEYVAEYLRRNYTHKEADYYGSINAMDNAIGLVRDLLQSYNISENTMLWFTSDNGPEKGTPGSTGGLRGRKRSLYEGGIRVPGIIEWPRAISENRVTDFPVVSSDFLPTVCDILGISPPIDRPIDGASVLPFIKGEIAVRTKSIAWAYRMNIKYYTRRTHVIGTYRAVLIRDRYKLHVIYQGNNIITKTTQLFDLMADPSESNDVSRRHSKLVASMRNKLERWRQSVIRSAVREVQCVN